VNRGGEAYVHGNGGGNSGPSKPANWELAQVQPRNVTV
jgi:hypothetical protein